MFFACGRWCVADVSSVSTSSEQTEGLWGNQCLNSWQLIYGDRKVKFCHWLKLIASNWPKINYVWNYGNENRSLIPLGRIKVPSLKMRLCSFLFRVSLFPRRS